MGTATSWCLQKLYFVTEETNHKRYHLSPLKKFQRCLGLCDHRTYIQRSGFWVGWKVKNKVCTNSEEEKQEATEITSRDGGDRRLEGKVQL